MSDHPEEHALEAPTEEMAAQLYQDLRRLAASFFRSERPEHTLQPTALVHEAYLKLADQDANLWRNRSHFLAVAGTAMRRVLLDAAEARGRQKRGGDLQRVTLTGTDAETDVLDVDVVDLDEALTKLAEVKERYVRIVELRYFAGLPLDEVAVLLGVSRTIVVREWARARAWLAKYLADAG